MLVGRSGLSPTMVGRATQLARLVGLLDGGGPAVALVGGEAGVGKTRLVRELLDAVPAGTVVLTGQADPGALGRPFELLLDAVSGHVPADDASLAELRRPTEGAHPVAERLRSAREVVARVVGERRAVIVFDDLHWADSESVALFEQLAGPEAGPVVLVGTYRPSEISRRHPLAEALPRLERRHGVAHLRLDRLDVADVQDFLGAVYGGIPPYRVAETLHARTGGNPYFLEALLTAAGGVPVDQLCSLPLPWNLAELVRGQVDDLPGDEQAVIETASVIGRRVTFDLLAAVTGRPERELIALLRSLIGHGLLVETDPDVFSFRHDLSREAIESRLLGREKRRLHEAALAALRDAGSADLAAMAGHAHGAGCYDELVELARLGTARSLAIGSSHQALGLAELGLSEAEGDLELRAGAARAAWLSGLFDDALRHARALEAGAEAVGDLDRRSEARRLLLRLHWDMDDRPSRRAVGSALVADLDRLGDTPEAARVLGALAQEAMLDVRFEDTEQWATKAVSAAERHDLPEVRLAALVERGSALSHRRGKGKEAVDLLLQVADAAERQGEDLIAARALNNAAFMAAGHIDRAAIGDLFERMRAAAARAGFDPLAASAYLQGRAELAIGEGDMAEAQRWLDEARRAERGSHSQNDAWSALQDAWLNHERGDPVLAQAELEELPRLTAEQEQHAIGLRAAVEVALGQVSATRARLAGLLGGDREEALDGASLKPLVPFALDAGLGPDDLRPLVERVTRYEMSDNEVLDLWRLRADAHLTLAEGRSEEAVARFEALLSRPEVVAIVDAPERAIDHVGAARALLLVRRSDDAAAHADEAARLLGRWVGWRRAALATLERRLGRGDDTVIGPPELTPREREVVALLAEGLTNPELAERLYISPRTAGVHVSNILAKLGMSSRTEVAAWAVRAGLETS